MTDLIRGLVNEVRKRSGEHGLTLTRVHIGEIDELTDTIEDKESDFSPQIGFFKEIVLEFTE